MSSSQYRITRFKGFNSHPGPIEIWDIDTSEQLAALPSYIDVKFSKWQTSCLDRLCWLCSMERWDWTRAIGVYVDQKRNVLFAIGNHDGTVKTDEDSIRALTFAKDNQTLISESRGNIKIWSISSGELVKGFTIPETRVGGFYAEFNDGTHFSGDRHGVFTQNGDNLIIQTKNGTEIWNTLNGKKLNTFTTTNWGWDPSTMNEELLVYGIGSRIYIRDLRKDEHVGTLETSKGFFDGFLDMFHFRNFNVFSLAFTPDGRTLAVGNGDKKIQLWDVENQRLIETISGHQHAVCELVFSADGKILASGDTGGKIHLWEFATRKHLATYKASKRFVHTLAFTPDGKPS